MDIELCLRTPHSDSTGDKPRCGNPSIPNALSNELLCSSITIWERDSHLFPPEQRNCPFSQSSISFFPSDVTVIALSLSLSDKSNQVYNTHDISGKRARSNSPWQSGLKIHPKYTAVAKRSWLQQKTCRLGGMDKPTRVVSGLCLSAPLSLSHSLSPFLFSCVNRYYTMFFLCNVSSQGNNLIKLVHYGTWATVGPAKEKH